MISLFGNKNEVSDTQRELEEYMKKRSQDNSGMNFNGYYSPDSFTGNTPQQGYAQSDSQAEYRNETGRNAEANAVWKSEISFKGGAKNLSSGIAITAVVSVIGLALAVFLRCYKPYIRYNGFWCCYSCCWFFYVNFRQCIENRVWRTNNCHCRYCINGRGSFGINRF